MVASLNSWTRLSFVYSHQWQGLSEYRTDKSQHFRKYSVLRLLQRFDNPQDWSLPNCQESHWSETKQIRLIGQFRI